MFAVFEKKYKNDYLKVFDCILFDSESKAQWFCLINQDYMYRKIKG